MVSSVPTLSSKMLKSDRKDTHLHSRSVFAALLKPVFAAALLSVVWFYPFESFLALVSLHALFVPVGLVVYYGFAKDKEA
eukprot:3411638-Rhodomonas_salina.2